jgi:hypothetical protein
VRRQSRLWSRPQQELKTLGAFGHSLLTPTLDHSDAQPRRASVAWGRSCGSDNAAVSKPIGLKAPAHRRLPAKFLHHVPACHQPHLSRLRWMVAQPARSDLATRPNRSVELRNLSPRLRLSRACSLHLCRWHARHTPYPRAASGRAVRGSDDIRRRWSCVRWAIRCITHGDRLR